MKTVAKSKTLGGWAHGGGVAHGTLGGQRRGAPRTPTHITHEALEDHQLSFQLFHLHGEFLLTSIRLLGLLQPGGNGDVMSMWEQVWGGTGSRASGVATLTSWSSFTRSCSCVRTVYSSSHLTDIGKGERTQPRVPDATTPPPSPPL